MTAEPGVAPAPGDARRASSAELAAGGEGGEDPRGVDLARRTIAHHSRSFALASRLLDRRTRDQAAIVYTFCRWVDDAVDEPDGDARVALTRLYHQLDQVYAGTAEEPVLGAFAEIVRVREIPRQYPGELLAGMTMDVIGTRYLRLEHLHRYAFRVAGVVGLMMCHVFGVRDDDALVPAARLGVAMQLTNVCRDISEDWARGRCYLPDDLLAAHGAEGLADEIGGALPRSALPAIARVVRELLALADDHYRAAAAGIPALPWRAALAVRAASSIYAAIGGVIASRGHDVTAPRAVVSRTTKLALLASAAARTLATRPDWLAAPTHIPVRRLEIRDVPV